jgi:RHS repeat-associated protein
VSGTLQGAGGVGGLLRSDETIGTNATTTHYYWYDGNGNVTGLMRGNGTVDATYRYCSLCRPTAQSPYGLTSGQAVSPAPAWLGSAFGGKAESTVTPGTYAERNRYRFSTKYLDDEVETNEGTYYYGYRSYTVALGRWLSRDPIGEEGGVNLYGMVFNHTVGLFDLLGQECVCSCTINVTYDCKYRPGGIVVGTGSASGSTNREALGEAGRLATNNGIAQVPVGCWATSSGGADCNCN